MRRPHREDGGVISFFTVLREGVRKASVDVGAADGDTMMNILLHAASWIAAAELIALACFQVLLACGVPLGRLAWGGAHKRLPMGLRIASLASAVICALGAMCVLERAGVITLCDRPGAVRVFVWMLTILFGLSTIGNLASKSTWERRVMTPVAATLALMCLIVSITAG